MSREEVLKQFRNIIFIFKQRGCTEEEIVSFINNNVDFVLENKDQIIDKISLIYNKDNLYGLIFVSEDDYQFAVKQKDNLQKMKSKDDHSDYIIEMMIRFASAEKVKKIVPTISNMTVEDQIKTLKKIGLNREGYHFR